MGGFRGAPKRWAWWHFSSPNWQYNIYHVYLIVLAFWGVIYATYQTHLLGEPETTIVSQDFFEKVTEGQAINSSL